MNLTHGKEATRSAHDHDTIRQVDGVILTTDFKLWLPLRIFAEHAESRKFVVDPAVNVKALGINRIAKYSACVALFAQRVFATAKRRL